jgi:hypothetical protein
MMKTVDRMLKSSLQKGFKAPTKESNKKDPVFL